MRAAVLTLVAAAACGEDDVREWRPEDHGQPRGAAEDDTDRVAVGPTKAGGSSELVLRAWSVACASCHGAEGRGDGPGKPPNAVVPDFTLAEWQASRTDEQLKTVITTGRGLMPGFANQMPPRAIDALVRHVRSFRR